MTGEICVAADHRKERYDRLWATEQRQRARPRAGTAPATSATSTPRAGCGSRAGWCTSHHGRRAAHPGRGRAAGRGAARRSSSAAVVGRRAGRHPAGVVVVVAARRAPSRRATRWPTRTWPPRCARSPASDVAAVLVVPRCPSTSGTTPRSTGRPWPAWAGAGPGRRPAREARVKVLVTGASGLLGGAVGPGAGRARRRRHGAAAPPVRARAAARCWPTSPTPPPSGAAVRRAGRGRAPRRQGRRHRARGATTSGPTSSAPAHVLAACRARRRDRGSSRSRRRRSRTPARRWSARAPARPTRSTPAATTPAARRWPS